PLFRASPKCIKDRYHSLGEEHRVSLVNLAVIDVAACDDLIFEHPGFACLSVFLDVSRHMRVASAANGDIDRRQTLPHVRHPEAKPDVLDHLLDIGCGFNAQGFLAAPFSVAM